MHDIVSILPLAILGVLYFLQHRFYSEKISELTKALIAKNAQEFADLKRVDQPRKDVEVVSDEIPLNTLDDALWLKKVTEEAE